MNTNQILREASKRIYDAVKDMAGTEKAAGDFGRGAGGDIPGAAPAPDLSRATAPPRSICAPGLCPAPPQRGRYMCVYIMCTHSCSEIAVVILRKRVVC